MRTRSFLFPFAAFAALVLLLLGCPLPSTQLSGSLAISFTNDLNARTLLPAISMDPASYTVNGSGPGSASFSRSVTTAGTVMVDSLVPGQWTITVNAYNASYTLIGQGAGSGTVHTGQSETVAVSVVPLTGNGSLSLAVSWPSSQVWDPSIKASLTPSTGSALPLDFSVSGGQASFTSSSIPAGYFTLSLQLFDSQTPVMGAVEVVRIAAGAATTGSYDFGRVNGIGGTVLVNISPAMANPIPVGLYGAKARLGPGESMTVSASALDGTPNVTWVWYLNGVSAAIGYSATLGSALAPGYYRLDVTGFNADGTRGGSATASLHVTALPPGTITTVAGDGIYGTTLGDGGPATSAFLREPYGIAADAAGNLYIADTYNYRVRKVTPGGVIDTVAGNGTAGGQGDNGSATSAQLNQPSGVAVDAAGNLYIADTLNHRIRKVSTSGIITTVAGTGTRGYSADGVQAVSAQLEYPSAIAVDAAGNLYYNDTTYEVVRKISTAGTITTVAGTGVSGYSGDGGPAVQAKLGAPRGIAVDSAGNLYIADSDNNIVRVVTPDGQINTVAGNRTMGYGGDGGQATSASLSNPWGVAVDAANNLYIAEFYNDTVRMVTPGGVISTVAGTGNTVGYSGDGGPAVSARLNSPVGVAIDGDGNIFIDDLNDFVIRRVTAP